MGNGLRFRSEADLPMAIRERLAAQGERDTCEPIVINIAVRTPTLNVWQRMHWSKRRKVGQEIADLIALGAPRRPVAPLAKCRVLIERYSRTSPDIDGLIGGLKPVLDALQPMSKRHPYGLGFIADDNPACVIDFKAVHVQGSEKRTRITITPVSP